MTDNLRDRYDGDPKVARDIFHPDWQSVTILAELSPESKDSSGNDNVHAPIPHCA
jgi:hypothetical protein